MTLTATTGSRQVVLYGTLCCLVGGLFQVQAALQYGDRWNYDKTMERKDGFYDFGPEEWGNIECDESTPEGLDACLGYRDKWHAGQSWQMDRNYCRWCPSTLADTACGRHHMSPINLQRNRGLGYWNKTEENNGNPGPDAHPEAEECIDEHWMKYEDSSCDLKQLLDANAFTIERHALRITQPITILDHKTNELRIDCEFPNGRGRKFGRIDFSRGFSQWWFLSHIDIHTPSEHTQEGKRYDAELQMHHFYSVRMEKNEIATVSIFLQAYDTAQPYRYLDKLICLWRRYEQTTRSACQLPPITDPYPGCFPPPRRVLKTREEPKPKSKSPFPTITDWILAKDRHQEQNRPVNTSANTTKFPSLVLDDVNFEDAEMDDEEWFAFIAQESARFQSEEKVWRKLHRELNNTDQAHEAFHQRYLMGGNNLDFFNYFAMLGVRTEYYFRYVGSQTTPPCYGDVEKNSQRGSNHWRVMKDPIRIHQRQLREMQRLLRERIAPKDDPVMACQRDTAAKVGSDGTVDTARPLQATNPAHYDVFCECKDWPSKWPEDREWCRNKNATDRFYSQPYNFKGSEF